MTLPQPAILLTVDLPLMQGGAVRKQPFYTEHQMRDAITQAVWQERQEVLQTCYAVRNEGDSGKEHETYDDGFLDGCNNCISPIFERSNP